MMAARSRVAPVIDTGDPAPSFKKDINDGGGGGGGGGGRYRNAGPDRHWKRRRTFRWRSADPRERHPSSTREPASFADVHIPPISMAPTLSGQVLEEEEEEEEEEAIRLPFFFFFSLICLFL